MKKLTAGIFAGILTIVTVNAADAAIASKAYVDQKHNVNAGEISTLKTTVGEHTASIGELKETVNNLSGDGVGSVANQIAGALGELGAGNTTVADALNKKADKTALDETNANVTANTSAISAANEKITANTNSITTLNGADTVEGSVKKQIKDAITTVNTAASELAGRVTTAEGAIDILNGEGEGSVKKALADAKAYADTAESDAVATANQNTSGLLGTGVTTENTVTQQFAATNANVTANATAIEDITKENGTIDTKISAAQSALNAEIGKKQNLLNDTNVKTTGTGNVISAVVAENGSVAITKDINAVTVPKSQTPSEAGTYVLTATVAGDGTPTYYWESIERATAQPAVE